MGGSHYSRWQGGRRRRDTHEGVLGCVPRPQWLRPRWFRPRPWASPLLCPHPCRVPMSPDVGDLLSHPTLSVKHRGCRAPWACVGRSCSPGHQGRRGNKPTIPWLFLRGLPSPPPAHSDLVTSEARGGKEISPALSEWRPRDPGSRGWCLHQGGCLLPQLAGSFWRLGKPRED